VVLIANPEKISDRLASPPRRRSPIMYYARKTRNSTRACISMTLGPHSHNSNTYNTIIFFTQHTSNIIHNNSIPVLGSNNSNFKIPTDRISFSQDLFGVQCVTVAVVSPRECNLYNIFTVYTRHDFAVQYQHSFLDAQNIFMFSFVFRY